MTAPNEAGDPAPGPGPGGGSTDFTDQPAATAHAASRVADAAAAAPPRQHGAGRSRTASPTPPESSTPTESTAATHPPGADARSRRFVAGSPGSGAHPGQSRITVDNPDPVRNESQNSGRYGSELPDLSGPPPREAQRTWTEKRVQVSGRPRGPVRAKMQIRRVDPWSALKVSLLLSVALFFVWMFAVAFLYLVLGTMGVWSKLNSNVGDLLTSTNGAGELVSAGSIFGGAALIGLVDVVLLTAMSTLGAVIYNVSTDVVGGVEITLADRE